MRVMRGSQHLCGSPVCHSVTRHEIGLCMEGQLPKSEVSACRRIVLCVYSESFQYFHRILQGEPRCQWCIQTTESMLWITHLFLMPAVELSPRLSSARRSQSALGVSIGRIQLIGKQDLLNIR